MYECRPLQLIIIELLPSWNLLPRFLPADFFSADFQSRHFRQLTATRLATIFFPLTVGAIEKKIRLFRRPAATGMIAIDGFQGASQLYAHTALAC
jgi:hypothetical protein